MGTWVDFQAVKQAVTIGQVFDHYGIKLKRTGKELHGRCPIHQGKGEDLSGPTPRRTPFSASPARSKATCWISWRRWRSAQSGTRR